MERVLSLAPFPQSPLATLSPRMKFQRPGLTPPTPAHHPSRHPRPLAEGCPACPSHTQKPLCPLLPIPQPGTYDSCLPFKHQAASFNLSLCLLLPFCLCLCLLDSPLILGFTLNHAVSLASESASSPYPVC